MISFGVAHGYNDDPETLTQHKFTGYASGRNRRNMW